MPADSTRQVDAIIVGAGLAGTTLAWMLQAQGHSVVLIGNSQAGASHAAAGLITPVTGTALRAEPDFARLLAAALRHYRSVEQSTVSSLLSAQPIRRILSAPKERKAWRNRGALGIAYADGCMNPRHIALRCGFRLDVRAYLNSAHTALAVANCMINAHVHDDDIDETTSGINIARLGLHANQLILCRGAEERHSTLFTGVTWRCAKGEVLHVRSTQPFADYRIHGNGVWLSPAQDDTALLGATYAWDDLDNLTSDAARDTLLAKAQDLAPGPLHVIKHYAGVRPIVEGRRPVIGPAKPRGRIHILNGLGSKGVLYAPFLAQQMILHLTSHAPVPERFAWRVRAKCD